MKKHNYVEMYYEAKRLLEEQKAEGLLEDCSTPEEYHD